MQDWLTTWKIRNGGRRVRLSSRRIDKATILKYLGILSLIGVVLGIILLLIILAWTARSLPDPNTVIRRDGFSTKIVDRDGETLYDLYTDYNRLPVKFEEISPLLRQATVAVEDKEFYKHEGFSIWGIVS